MIRTTRSRNVDNGEKAAFDHANDFPAYFLVLRPNRIERHLAVIKEHLGRVRERHAMLIKVASRFPDVPFEGDCHSPRSYTESP
jgi:hypothetical protein